MAVDGTGPFSDVFCSNVADPDLPADPAFPPPEKPAIFRTRIGDLHLGPVLKPDEAEGHETFLLGDFAENPTTVSSNVNKNPGTYLFAGRLVERIARPSEGTMSPKM